MKIRFNLLPKKQKKHLYIQKILRTIMEQEIHVMILFLFLVVGLFSMSFILTTETNIMQEVKVKVVEQEQYKDITETHNKFKDIHKKINSVNVLMNDHVKWSQLFVILSENISEYVTVKSIKVNSNTIIINGVADTREDVMDMKDMFSNIVYNDVNCFDSIIVPETELTVPVNLLFTMTLKINLECLK